MTKVGILDLQGSIIEHKNMLKQLDGIKPINVKYAEDLDKVDGLILPGGESTAIGKLLNDFKLMTPITKRVLEGMPIWGTCAGLILLAKRIDGKESSYFSLMDIHVKRNAYGSQINSFIVNEPIKGISNTPIPLVFIRAPYIEEVGRDVDILKIVRGNIVAARQKNMLVTSFHPELTNNLLVHKYFISMIEKK